MRKGSGGGGGGPDSRPARAKAEAVRAERFGASALQIHSSQSSGGVAWVSPTARGRVSVWPRARRQQRQAFVGSPGAVSGPPWAWSI
eukprot:4647664-Heterocapsa_arctica.AAC.1